MEKLPFDTKLMVDGHVMACIMGIYVGYSQAVFHIVEWVRGFHFYFLNWAKNWIYIRRDFGQYSIKLRVKADVF